VSIGGGLWASIASSQGCQGFTENFCKHYSHSAVVYDPIVNVGRFINDTVFDNCGNIETGRSGSATVYSRCSFGMAYGAVAGSRLVTKLSTLSYAPVEAVDCLFGSAYNASDDLSSPTLMQTSDYCLVTNRQADVTQHTLTKFNGITNRDNATAYRSPSAVQLRPTTASVALTNTVNITAVAGTALRVIGYLRYDSNLTGATLPSVTLSGAGSTPATYTQTGAANAWEKFDLTVTPAANGTVTLVTTAVSTSATANVWLSGVCTSPWVSSSRHYGFVPVVGIATQSVDTQISVTNESTVAAYTTLETQAKLYDRLALWGCDNPSSAIFFSQAGGTLDLGSKNLIVDATAASAFLIAGNNITIKATTLTGSKIVTTGTVSFANGASSTLIYQDSTGLNVPITVSGLVAGSRVQLKNTTTSTIISSTVVAGTSSFQYYSYTTADTIRLRVMAPVGANSYNLYESSGVISATGIAFLVNQSANTVYNSNGIDGTAITGVTWNIGAVDIDLSGLTSIGWKPIYATYCAQLFTANGIETFSSLVAAPDPLTYVFDASIVFNNLSGTGVVVGGDGYGSRSDGAYLGGTGNIQFNNGKAYLANSSNIPTDAAAAVWAYVARTLTAGTRDTEITALHKIAGLESGSPLTVTPTSRAAGGVSQTISGDGVASTTVTRV
jgi:hypothetical protein